MKKVLAYLLLGFGLTSCGLFADKVDFFNNINFTEEAEWLFVRTNTDHNASEIIYDKETLSKLSKELTIKSTNECAGTTPDNCLALYKNGKQLKSFCYCSWEPYSFDFGQLQSAFIPAALKIITAYSIERHDFVLDSLKKIKNVYLLYPRDTSIVFPNELTFDIKLMNTGQDIFEQEKPIEAEFKKFFKDEKYQVKADWYLSEIGPPKKLGYHIKVDCDSSFIDSYHQSVLLESPLFKDITGFKYSKKHFDIRYYVWNK